MGGIGEAEGAFGGALGLTTEAAGASVALGAAEKLTGAVAGKKKRKKKRKRAMA